MNFIAISEIRKKTTFIEIMMTTPWGHLRYQLKMKFNIFWQVWSHQDGSVHRGFSFFPLTRKTDDFLKVISNSIKIFNSTRCRSFAALLERLANDRGTFLARVHVADMFDPTVLSISRCILIRKHLQSRGVEFMVRWCMPGLIQF